jgi:multidrug efflux pump subunit AcrA (membrane-fusion protein)
MAFLPPASRFARPLPASGLLFAAGCLAAGGCGFSLDRLTDSAPEAASAPVAKTVAAEAAGSPRSEPPAAEAPPGFKVEPRTWQATVRSQGGLIADELALIGARMAGRITEVAVEVGQRVTAGDALVRLDEAELRLRVEQAWAQLSRARVSLGLGPVSDDAEAIQCPDDTDTIDVAAEPRAGGCGGVTRHACGSAQRPFDLVKKDLLQGCDGRGSVCEKPAQSLRHGDHPLPHGHRGDDVVGEVGGGL